MRIVLTGATGLIGSRFEELMFENHEIVPLSSSGGVNITDKDSVEEFFSGKDFDVLIHLAGKTDVDGCEFDKGEDLQMLGVSEEEVENINISTLDKAKFINKTTAVAVNSIGTANLYEVAKARGKKFVYISSDFVFSGDEEFYTEQSHPKPVNWYGTSKYLGEKLIDVDSDLIVRLSFPYGYRSPVKKDLVWRLTDLMQEREEVSLISDQVITPTFIDDIVKGLETLLLSQQTGIYHLTGSSYISPFEIGQKIKEVFHINCRIVESSLESVYEGKARRPFQSRMKNDKLYALGFKPKAFDEGLALISTA